MAYECIVVPYDGSDHAQSALAAACGIAKGHDTKVHVVNVVPINIFPEVASTDPAAVVSPSYVTQKTYSELFDDTLLQIHQEMMGTIGNTFDELKEDQVTYEVIAHPSAVEGIIDYASDHNCDLIVMGRRGLGALRGLLGSVSYGVIRATKIPVLTVK
ncbi:universal stress protein [Anaerotardibacter muris]|uniref:universal stress protein n=1 Tax=Anaerotardibacter muris TaxID=2941505 RepID=UPI00203B8D15|nr:universal stress protein [Anaerotardibacter muris]